MVARAYVLGIGRGAASPPVPPSALWPEPFNQADYATLKAQYDADTGVSQTFTDDGFRIVSGGAITMVSDGGAHAGEFVHLQPDILATPVNEFWAKIELEVIGAPYDDSQCPVSFQTVAYTTGTDSQFAMQGSLSGGRTYGTEAFGTGSNQDIVRGSKSCALPVGTHTFIICCSRSGGSNVYESWIDAAPGDPADTTSTVITDALGFDCFDVFIQAGTSAGRNTRVSDILVVVGPRARNPFGIL